MEAAPEGAVEVPMFCERHTGRFTLLAPFSGKLVGFRPMAADVCLAIIIPGPMSNVEAGASIEFSLGGGMH